MNTKLRLTKDKKIVVLTGAGISAESGLKTFRDNNGLWENHRVEEVCTPEAFIANPSLVWKFYKQRYFQLEEVKPNMGHEALVRLEHYLGDNFHLITQNVDGLHRLAGNKNVLEMHGTLNQCFCLDCKKYFAMSDSDLTKAIPLCPECGGKLRPDIVWFGEMPYFMDQIEQLLADVDIFIVIGTSGVVYPAAQFLMIAKYRKAYTVGINLTEPENRYYIDEFHLGKSGDILPKLVSIWIDK